MQLTMKTKKFENVLIPAGMAGTLVYMLHTIIGAKLWPEYNPVTTDISTLTAEGSPDAGLLRIFTLVYGVLMIFFAAGMVLRAFRVYNKSLKIAFALLLIMEAISLVGYGLFPLNPSLTMGSIQNTMHMAVTGIVVFTTIAFAYFAAFGYLNQEGLKRFGKFVRVIAVLITVFGIFNVITIGIGWPLLGLTERAVIFSIMLLLFAISNFETFIITPYNT